MNHYRITIQSHGPVGTDLVSGTIWGHLAWAIRYLEGESNFLAWLKGQHDHPWLVSSWMPLGMLPKPLLTPTFTPPRDALPSDFRGYKKIKKMAFISETMFVKLRKQLCDNALTSALMLELEDSQHTVREKKSFLSGLPFRQAHNRIDRMTGRTPESGGLFFEDMNWHAEEADIQIFVCTPEPCQQKLQNLFDFIENNGFGANASTGCGAMKFTVQEEKHLFEDGGSRAVSLSHGVLTDDMESPRYKQHVHFGKLGGHFAVGGHSPFKYPVLMIKPGATFTVAGRGPFGRLLDNVHHDPLLSGIRHHALHLPLFFTEAMP